MGHAVTPHVNVVRVCAYLFTSQARVCTNADGLYRSRRLRYLALFIFLGALHAARGCESSLEPNKVP